MLIHQPHLRVLRHLSRALITAVPMLLLLLLLSRFSRVRLCATPDSVRPHRQQPTRLRRPWDSPGKNTGVGCHFMRGILQTRILEWVAIAFSNAWKWKLKGKLLSCCRLLVTSWTAAYQAPLSMGFSRQEYWSGVPLPSPITIITSVIMNEHRGINFMQTVLYPFLNKYFLIVMFHFAVNSIKFFH